MPGDRRRGGGKGVDFLTSSFLYVGGDEERGGGEGAIAVGDRQTNRRTRREREVKGG